MYLIVSMTNDMSKYVYILCMYYVRVTFSHQWHHVRIVYEAWIRVTFTHSVDQIVYAEIIGVKLGNEMF